MKTETINIKDAAKAFYELGWAENETDAKLCFESGAEWQKEKDKAIQDKLI